MTPYTVIRTPDLAVHGIPRKFAVHIGPQISATVFNVRHHRIGEKIDQYHSAKEFKLTGTRSYAESLQRSPLTDRKREI
jgi:hypothetical protein